MKRFLNISLMCIAMLHGVIGYGQICSQSLVSNSIIFDDTLQLCENNDIIVKVRLDSCDSVSGCNELCEQYSHIWLRNGLLLFDYSVDSLVVNSPGNYCLKTVWFHQNGQNTCYCDTLQSTFTVLAPPVPIIIPDIFACLGDTLSFQGVNLSNWDTLNFYSNDIELSLPIAVDSTLLLEVLGVNRFGCQTSDLSLVTPLNSGLIADNKAVCYGEEGWVIESVEDAFMNSQQINLQWQYSQDGLVWSNITGANSQSFIPVPPVAFATGQFRRMSEYNLAGLSCPSNACEFVVLGNTIPEAGPDQTLCEGQAISLNPENCMSCAWSNGIVDGAFLSQDEVLILTDNRIFDVFEDTVSCIYLDSLEVTIVNLDAGEVASNQVLCFGHPMAPIESVQDASGDGQYQVNWQFSDDGTVWTNLDNETNQTLNLSEEVTQDVFFRREVSTIVNELGCAEFSNMVEIHILGDSSAHVMAGQDLTVCQGEPVFLNPQGCETYAWVNDVVSGVILSEDELLIVTGTNTYTYLNDSYACSDSDSLNVTVVNVNPGAIASSQVLCYGQPVQPFESVEDALGDGDVVLSWQYSSDGIQWSDLELGASQTYNYPISAETNMSFRRVISATYNELTCEGISNLVFVSVPNGELVITGPDSEICRNSSFVYLASNAENSNCSWSIDGGEVMSIAQNGMAVFIHQGYGDSSVVTLNATHVLSGCTQTVDYVLYASEGEASDTVNVFVLDAIDHLLTFTPAIPESLISWGYSDPNGTVIADQLSSSQFCYYETLDPESYVYWVEITNSEGCTTRSYLNFANQLVGVSNTDLTPSPTILPNPFMNECTIFNPSQSMLRITVVDALGKFIEQTSLMPLQTIRMGSNWNSGIHIIQAVNQDGANFVFRAIKN